MSIQETEQELQGIIEKIKRSGALGRSPAYAKLLEYLAEVTVSGELCSEVSVAIDVFKKGDDYDATSDSTVRVYIYNLRQKLTKYYEESGVDDPVRISVPKGAYRLSIERREPQSITEIDSPDDLNEVTNKTGTSSPVFLSNKNAQGISIILLAGLCLFLCSYILFAKNSPEFEVTIEQREFWGSLLTDEKSVMIVVGDYYIFAEQDYQDNRDGDVRLVREFNINSEYDLRQKIEGQDSDLGVYQFDLGLTYLPRGSAFAISNIENILLRAGKKPRISMMSEFSAEDLRAHHIIYVGYISGLGVLEDYMFSGSKFDIGDNYDEIMDTETGEMYISDFIVAEEDRNFVDYGLISRSSIQGDNLGDSQLILLAGTRDAGLMEMSEIAAADDVITRLQLDEPTKESSVSLFEVYGFNLTNISSSLIVSVNSER